MVRTKRSPNRRVQVEQQLQALVAALAIPSLSRQFLLPSLTRLELTNDLKDGTLWFTAAPSESQSALVDAARQALPRWRRQLRHQLSLRYVPNFLVRYDVGQADSLRIDALLEADHV
jgi:ribosome-binding factor A